MPSAALESGLQCQAREVLLASVRSPAVSLGLGEDLIGIHLMKESTHESLAGFTGCLSSIVSGVQSKGADPAPQRGLAG